MIHDTAFQVAASNIRFGRGVTREVGMDLVDLGARHTMIVMDRALVVAEVGRTVTDALRALALEISGYRTQVVEFIELEHTAKNVLIRAVRRDHDGGETEKHVAAYRELKAAWGLGDI